MEPKPLGAPSTFCPFNPILRSHLHPHIDSWRASRMAPFSHNQMARDNVRQRRAAQEPNEDERFATPATLIWTRHPRPSSDRSLSVPAALPLKNAGLRCRRAPVVLKWTIKLSVVGRSKMLAPCAEYEAAFTRRAQSEAKDAFARSCGGHGRPAAVLSTTSGGRRLSKATEMQKPTIQLARRCPLIIPKPANGPAMPCRR